MAIIRSPCLLVAFPTWSGAFRRWIILNANRYVDRIVRKYEVEKGPGTAVYQAGERLRGLIQRWYAVRLVRVHNSGSFAKGTSIKGGTDLDLFISLKPKSGKSLKKMFEGLHQYAHQEGLRPRRQNASIGVEVNGVKVDLVPARMHSGKSDHSLYLNRRQGWTKTNVDKHIALVRRSGKAPLSAPPRYGGQTVVCIFPRSILSLRYCGRFEGVNPRAPLTS